jgi:hypothetical protein
MNYCKLYLCPSSYNCIEIQKKYNIIIYNQIIGFRNVIVLVYEAIYQPPVLFIYSCFSFGKESFQITICKKHC